MDCPNCGTQMVPGMFSPDSSLIGFGASGTSWESLWFRRGRIGAPWSDDKTLVLASGEQRIGFLCPSCGAASLGPTPDNADLKDMRRIRPESK